MQKQKAKLTPLVLKELLVWQDANGDGVAYTNNNGKFDAGELKTWQDANGNGTAEAGETRSLSELGISELNYAMGTFTRNGQTSLLASPDLAADTAGTRVQLVPEGIIIETTGGQTSLLVTAVDDKSQLQANRDGVAAREDTDNIYAAADLLRNDTLAGMSGQALSIAGVSNFTNGTGWLDGNGNVHFAPTANYFGAANDSAWFCERRAA